MLCFIFYVVVCKEWTSAYAMQSGQWLGRCEICGTKPVALGTISDVCSTIIYLYVIYQFMQTSAQ